MSEIRRGSTTDGRSEATDGHSGQGSGPDDSSQRSSDIVRPDGTSPAIRSALDTLFLAIQRSHTRPLAREVVDGVQDALDPCAVSPPLPANPSPLAQPTAYAPPLYSPGISEEVAVYAQDLATHALARGLFPLEGPHVPLYRHVRACMNRAADCDPSRPTLDDESISEGIVRALNAHDDTRAPAPPPADSLPATALSVGDAVTDLDTREYAATCPTCGTVGKAVAAYRQTTRREPCTFLGFTGYCRPCGSDLLGMASFPATDVQLPLVANPHTGLAREARREWAIRTLGARPSHWRDIEPHVVMTEWCASVLAAVAPDWREADDEYAGSPELDESRAREIAAKWHGRQA